MPAEGQNTPQKEVSGVWSGEPGRGRCCLLVTDVQYDFCEGSLAVPRGVETGEKIGQALARIRRRGAASDEEPQCSAHDKRWCCPMSSCQQLTNQAEIESICLSSEEGRKSHEEESIDAWFDLVVFSLDWHPSDHVSFVTSHSPECLRSICFCGGSGVSPAAQEAAAAAVEEGMSSLGPDRNWTVIPASRGQGARGASVVSLWPSHCVEGTRGSKLQQGIHPRVGDFVVLKGTSSSVRASAFLATFGLLATHLL